MKKPHIHTPNDGRGWRDVYLDGKLIDRVIFADEKRGIVHVVHNPLRIDKYKKKVRFKVLHGSVVVVSRMS